MRRGVLLKSASMWNDFTDYQTVFQRVFLLEGLPEPLTRSSYHLQFFDNHLTETNLFLRLIRDPKTKQWTRLFVKQTFLPLNDFRVFQTADVNLTEKEYEVLSVFEGNELRYNRYFFEYAGKNLSVDLYIGALWGLIIARAEFDDEREMKAFTPPSFIFSEITNDERFDGVNLFEKNFADIQQIVS